MHYRKYSNKPPILHLFRAMLLEKFEGMGGGGLLDDLRYDYANLHTVNNQISPLPLPDFWPTGRCRGAYLSSIHVSVWKQLCLESSEQCETGDRNL